MVQACECVNAIVEVVEMKQTDFRDYRNHLRRICTERTKDKNDRPIDFSGTVWFNFGKGERMCNGKLTLVNHPIEIWVGHTYNVAEAPQCISFFKK